MKNFKFNLIVSLILIVGGFVGGIFVVGDGKFLFDNAVGAFSSWPFIAACVVAAILFLSPFFSKFANTPSASSTGKGVTRSGEEMNQYYDARWITESELRTSPRFRYHTWNDVQNEKQDGILIRCFHDKGKLNINFTKSIHTLIIGTTGSGKTTLYIEPSIRIFSKMAAKPCMVITDPKGELYNSHSIQLQEAGYRVMVLDLRNPYASTTWNPMDNAYVNYHKGHNLTKLAIVHKGGDPKSKDLQLVEGKFGSEWYEFDGVAYPDKAVLMTDLEAKKQILIDDAENELRELANTIVPILSTTDKTWEQGAQDFLYGVMLAMLEDSLEPEKTGMTKERFNFYNLGKIAGIKDPDPDNPYQTLRDYMSGRSKLSKVPQLMGPVINNAANTAKSYFGVLNGKISIFQDGGICSLTSTNNMFFDDFTDKPSVLFIKVPDEKESRHCIATMCISQIYKKLIERASKTKDLKLPRPVHFLLDEFANLPKIEKMESLITVGRSRLVFFHLVIQAYSQLENKYGKDAADIIRGNCNVQVYIGTEDPKTKEEFSKMCGDISIETTNVSTSSSAKKTEDANKTTSKQVVTRPLIYPYELGQLPVNTVIVKIFQESPIKTPLTPWYKIPEFDKRIAKDKYFPSTPIDYDRILFNVEARNKKILGKKKPSFDDFDF
ncbi:MAG: type IV secretory system conjugative DNA transfer family protein [Clostridia bacterium]